MGKTSRLETLVFMSVLLWAAGACRLGAASPVDRNIRLLRGKDAGERVAAVIALGELGTRARKAVPALLIALDDPEPMVRERAAEALGKIGASDKKTILSLIGRFADEDPFVAGKAIGAVAGMGGAAVGHLLRSLADGKRRGALGRGDRPGPDRARGRARRSRH